MRVCKSNTIICTKTIKNVVSVDTLSPHAQSMSSCHVQTSMIRQSGLEYAPIGRGAEGWTYSLAAEIFLTLWKTIKEEKQGFVIQRQETPWCNPSCCPRNWYCIHSASRNQSTHALPCDCLTRIYIYIYLIFIYLYI